MATVKINDLIEITDVEEDDYYVIIDTSDSGNAKKVKAINSEESIGVFGYISTPAATSITEAETYYDLAGTFTNTFLESFTVSETGIKYVGVNDFEAKISWHGSFYSDTNNATICCGLELNGEIMEPSVQTIKLGLAETYGALSGTAVVTMSANDEILIKIKSDKALSTVTATSFTTALQKFY